MTAIVNTFITPLEQVTPGYWWVRWVYTIDATPGGKHTSEVHRSEWAIVIVKGIAPFLYLGHFHAKDDGIAWHALQDPNSLEFGCKLEEMAEGVTA